MYTDSTKEFAKTLTKKQKADHGIFFTPATVVEQLFEFAKEPKHILEPSCGTGQIVSACVDRFPHASITGVELDPLMVKVCADAYPRATIVEHDFLTWKSETKYDFIVGNPPFVVRPAGFASDPNIVRGRSNLYVEFLYKCLTEHLDDDGILAFVIPATIGNSKYYEPIRKLVMGMDILSFKVLEKHDFCDTSTRLCILVVRKSPGTGRYTYGDYLCEKEFANVPEKCIGMLDLTFKTGHCWAQMKEFFVKESDIPFLTTGNIASGSLVLGKKTKYLSSDTTKKYSGKALLVKTASAGRRGGKFVFGFSMIDRPAWAADNDVIIVRGPDEDLELVHEVLKNPKTLEFIDSIVNNGHISMGLLKSIPLLGDISTRLDL